MLKRIREQKLFLLSLVIILLDQCTKVLVKGFTLFGMTYQGMEINTTREVLGDFLRFTYVENPGMAFGVTFGDGKIFLSLFSIIAAGALAWYLYKLRNSSIWVQVGIMLLLSGAVGNLIDRVFYGVIFSESPLFYGKVVDFIDVDCPDFTLFGREISRWWIFNIADSCVSCGIVLLLFVNHRIPTLKALNAAPSSLTPVLHYNNAIEIVSYNPQWPLEFDTLKHILSTAINNPDVLIEHVGSTSVPGLASKPIIDIDIVIPTMQSFDQVKAALENLGYVYEGDKGIPQREAFRQSDARVPYQADQRSWIQQHVYVCPEHSSSLQEHRIFRDYLLQHPETIAEYSQLKKDLARRFTQDREGYTNAKTEFVHDVMDKVRPQDGMTDTQKAP